MFANTVIIGTLVAAIDRISQHNAVTGQLAATVTTVWRQRTDCTFETIKHMFFTAQTDFKALSLVVPTDLTTDISLHAFDSTHTVLFF